MIGIDNTSATRNRLRISATIASIDMPPCPPWPIISWGSAASAHHRHAHGGRRRPRGRRGVLRAGRAAPTSGHRYGREPSGPRSETRSRAPNPPVAPQRSSPGRRSRWPFERIGLHRGHTGAARSVDSITASEVAQCRPPTSSTAVVVVIGPSRLCGDGLRWYARSHPWLPLRIGISLPSLLRGGMAQVWVL